MEHSTWSNSTADAALHSPPPCPFDPPTPAAPIPSHGHPLKIAPSLHSAGQAHSGSTPTAIPSRPHSNTSLPTTPPPTSPRHLPEPCCRTRQIAYPDSDAPSPATTSPPLTATSAVASTLFHPARSSNAAAAPPRYSLHKSSRPSPHTVACHPASPQISDLANPPLAP